MPAPKQSPHSRRAGLRASARRVGAQSAPGPKKLAEIVLRTLEDCEAEDVTVLNVDASAPPHPTTVIVASARSIAHVGEIASRIAVACREAGASSPRVEGGDFGAWAELDVDRLSVRVFRRDIRPADDLGAFQFDRRSPRVAEPEYTPAEIVAEIERVFADPAKAAR